MQSKWSTDEEVRAVNPLETEAMFQEENKRPSQQIAHSKGVRIDACMGSAG